MSTVAYCVATQGVLWTSLRKTKTHRVASATEWYRIFCVAGHAAFSANIHMVVPSIGGRISRLYGRLETTRPSRSATNALSSAILACERKTPYWFDFWQYLPRVPHCLCNILDDMCMHVDESEIDNNRSSSTVSLEVCDTKQSST